MTHRPATEHPPHYLCKAAAENASNAKSELDANRKVIADGAADLVRELKEGKAQWLYLPPDSFLGTLAQDVIIPAAINPPKLRTSPTNIKNNLK